MQVPDLHLEELKFTESPTKTQIVNTLRSIETFLTRMGGALIADGSYRMGEQSIGTLLNATIQIRAAADAFEGGTATGLAVPAPGPVPVPPNLRRQ